MNTEAALLGAILASPEDDTPRLVYADWCEEHGELERAEFIRLQFEAQRHEEWSPARLDLDARADVLLERNRERWVREVPSWALDPDWPPGDQTFRRGFLDQVRVSAEQFLASSSTLFAAAPVRDVAISDIRDGGVALAAHADLGRLERVELSFMGRPVELPRFLDSPYLDNLVGLTLSLRTPMFQLWRTIPMLNDHGARAIANCPHFTRLRSLNVSIGSIGPAGIAALAASPYLGSLEALDIGNNPLGDKGVIRLAQSPLLPRLTELSLWNTGMGDRGLQALLAAGPGQLQKLQLGRHEDCLITRQGMQSFVRCEALSRLRQLDLSSWPLNLGLIQTIAGSPYLSGLRVLNLSGCRIDDDMAVELARSPSLRNLRLLDLQNNCFGARGLTALVRSPVLNTATRLELYNNPEIGDPGIAALAASEQVRELRRLSLVSTGLGLDGVRAVASSPQLAQLRELNLESSHFGDEGGRLLCESPYLREITCLVAFDCDLGADMKAALRARFGPAFLG